MIKFAIVIDGFKKKEDAQKALRIIKKDVGLEYARLEQKRGIKYYIVESE
jgi:hypothetical protein